MRKFFSVILILTVASYGILPAFAQQTGSTGATGSTGSTSATTGTFGVPTAPATEGQLGTSNPQSLPQNINQNPALSPDRRTITNQEGGDQDQNQRRNNADQNNQQQQNAAQPRPVKTAFQAFVEQSTSTPIGVYGADLFGGVPTTFTPVDHAPIPADYVIGPGDEVVIRAWGQIDVAFRGVVDRNGALYIPKVGTVHLAGVRVDQLQDFLHAAIGRVFRNFEMTASLGELRSMQIFVTGYARRPGTYTLGSLSTLLNAVFAVGGPSSNGSMRHIQLRRNGKTISDFDLYDVLLKGDKSKDSQLLPGDVMYFTPVGTQVAMVGTVRQPAIYELRDKAGPISEALGYAGGLDVLASGAVATIERINNRAVRIVDQIRIDDAGLARPMQDGDIVTFFPISSRFDNAVTLRGSVAQPGRHPYHEGMKISDLVPDLYALIPESHWARQNTIAMRSAEGNLSGQGAQLGTTDLTGVIGPQSRIARGIQEEVRSNTTEVNWDYALIERMDPKTLETHLINFNLRRAMIEPNSPANLVLQPGDIVTVFSQGDLRVPTELQAKFVYLEGEFSVPGVYKVEPGETLHHLVERVGGFTSKAYLYGSNFTRESVKVLQQQRLDEAVQRMEDEIQRNAADQATKSLNTTAEGSTYQFILSTQQKLLAQLRTIKAEGRIVFGIKPDQTNLSGVPDIPLEDGDRWIVPSQPNFVTVIGAVNNNASFVYRDGQHASEYLRDAGGGTRTADMGRAFVLKANGTVVGKRSGVFSKNVMAESMMPGDTVVIPEILEKGGFMRGLKDWATILSQFGLGAAAIKVLSQ